MPGKLLSSTTGFTCLLLTDLIVSGQQHNKLVFGIRQLVLRLSSPPMINHHHQNHHHHHHHHHHAHLNAVPPSFNSQHFDKGSNELHRSLVEQLISQALRG